MTQEKQKKNSNFGKKKEPKADQEMKTQVSDDNVVQKEHVSTETHSDEPSVDSATQKEVLLEDTNLQNQVSPDLSEPLPALSNIAQIDRDQLVHDLMFNKYFIISENEAKNICEDILTKGCHTLQDVKWFLAHSERKDLLEFLTKKYNLT